MADAIVLRDFFYQENVGSTDLMDVSTFAEGLTRQATELAALGDFPIEGLTPSPDGATLVLPVSAGIGVATDAHGRRHLVELLAGSTINCAVDVNNASTIPVALPRIISIVLMFDSVDSDYDVDGDNVTVPTRTTYSSALQVYAGAEGGAAPAVPVDAVLIADFTIAVAQAALHTADMSQSRARPAYGRQGTVGGVAAQVADLASTQLDNCRPYALEPQALAANAMKVGIRPGHFNLSDRQVSVPGQSILLAASPTGGHHRMALVWIDSTGTVQVSYGAEVAYIASAGTPSFEGRFPVAVIDLADTATTLIGGVGLLDVRPMNRTAIDVPNRYKFTAAGGETAVTIGNGWTFLVGAHAVQVYLNGALVTESAYVENADGSGINSMAALVAPVAVAACSIGNPAGGGAGDLAVVSGLAGIVPGHVGKKITIAGAGTYGNGTYRIEAYVSASAVQISTVAAGADANNGAITVTIAGDVVELVAPRVAGTNPVVSHAPTHAADGTDPIDYSVLGGMVAPGLELYTTAAGTIHVKPFAAIINGRMRAYAGGDFAVPNLGANTWCYLYAYFDGANVQLEASTTPPDTTRRMKSGDATRTYLSAYRTKNATVVRAFRRTGRRVDYSINQLLLDDSDGTNPLQGKINVGANGAVGLSGLVPPFVLFPRVMMWILDSAGGRAQLIGNGSQGNLLIAGYSAEVAYPTTTSGMIDVDGSSQVTAANVLSTGCGLVVTGYDD